LVRRHRFIADGWGWELPGGLVDEDEEPSEAALREVEDTTGYRPERLEHLITFRPLAETVDCQQVVFVSRQPERIGEATAASAGIEWVPLASVPGFIDAGQIWQAVTLVALLRLLTMDGQAAG